MLTIRTILHPTDFSEHSKYAFGLACALARDYGARILALHVAPPPVIGYMEGVIPPQLPVTDLDRVREQLQQVTSQDPEVAVEHRLLEGDATEEILRTAGEFPCDLIVMGTHGRSGIGRFLMGSVAERVVRRAPCPVVTVKDHRPGVPAAKGSKRAEVSEPAVSVK